MFYKETDEPYLEHHGIKGQKWGVRRFQNPDGSLTQAGRERYGTKSKYKVDPSGDLLTLAVSILANKAYNAIVNKVTNEVNDAISKSVNRKEDQKRDEWFDTNRHAFDSEYSIDTYTDEEKQNEINRFDTDCKTRSIKTLTDAPKLSEPMDAAQSTKIVNKNYPQPGYTMNCTRCTNAMVLREKGYDVKASGSDHGWYSAIILPQMYKGAQTKNFGKGATVKQVISKLESNGPGSYGDLSLQWRQNGGHSIFWKITNSGKLEFYDSQVGKKLSTGQAKKYLEKSYLSASEYTRLDNCEPTDDALTGVEPNI